MNLDNSGRPRKQKKYLMFLITPECHLMMFRGEKVFFSRAVEQMHFQSSSLVLPSETCNWFNFHLAVKVKPVHSILPPLGTSVPPNAACSKEQPVALGRRRN